MNESTIGENFADQWNLEPARVTAFYQWHEKVLSDFIALRDAEGLDKIVGIATEHFGEKVMNRVMTTRTNKITSTRKSKLLSVASTVGLLTSPAPASTPMPKNTFFGD